MRSLEKLVLEETCSEETLPAVPYLGMGVLQVAAHTASRVAQADRVDQVEKPVAEGVACIVADAVDTAVGAALGEAIVPVQEDVAYLLVVVLAAVSFTSWRTEITFILFLK